MDNKVIDTRSKLINMGKRGADTIRVLGNMTPFINALKSNIGQEILKDDISRHDELLVKVYNETITPVELGEFRYLKARLIKVSERVSNYIKLSEEVEQK